MNEIFQRGDAETQRIFIISFLKKSLRLSISALKTKKRRLNYGNSRNRKISVSR